MIRPEHIQINHQNAPLGISPRNLRITWTCTGAKAQSAFQLILKDGRGEVLYNSGKQGSNAMFFDIPVELPYKKRIGAFLKLWDEQEKAGEIAGTAFETGPDLTSLEAKWIDPEGRINPKERQPASYLRKVFQVKTLGRGRIYATAHGILDVYLNGIHLDDKLLLPGASQYPGRLPVHTIDCTEALKEGENEILVTLGDGWYRGNRSNNLYRNVFGKDVVLLLQLEVNGKTLCATDSTWQASQSGPLSFNDMMLGETIDARREITDWHGVNVKPYKLDNLIYPESVPVRRQERFTAKLLTTPAGEQVLDFGVNIAGFVEFRLEERAGQEITLVHGEVLDEGGNFTIENYRNPSRPEVKYQQVNYICKDGINIYRPTKCYFGFRYVKVEGLERVNPENFTAISIYSDMPQVGFFSCGDERVNQLFANVLRSMKGNFVDVPTDCPTREKDGWSGDAQVFVHTAMYLMDCCDMFAKWLREFAWDQQKDGKLPSVAPRRNVPSKFSLSSFMDGSVGWCDAIAIIPAQLQVRYGDGRIGQEVYENMKGWVGYLLKLGRKSHKEHSGRVPRELWPYFVDHGFLWGEWLEPGQDNRNYMRDLLKTGDPEVATAYLAVSARLVADFARQQGKTEEEKHYRQISEKAKLAYRYVATDDGKITGSRQCRYVRPVAMDLLSEREKQRAVDDLAQVIKDNGNRLNTGFLTTHYLCRTLSDWGHADTAYDLLLQEELPSWLFSVKMGATSIWETWDAVRPDGTVRDSMNHYSEGSVAGWLFDSVCGIRLENGCITICPSPDRRLGHAEAVYHSPIGRISSRWEYEGDQVRYTIEIPCNASAVIRLPGREETAVSAGVYNF